MPSLNNKINEKEAEKINKAIKETVDTAKNNNKEKKKEITENPRN
jgi:hypothetical protein